MTEPCAAYMATIRKFLDLSTGYLTQATRDLMTEAARENTGRGGVAPSLFYSHPEYGWFVWVPDAESLPSYAPGSGEYEVPADMMACLLRARALKCDYICFDRDGPDNCDGLTWYGDGEAAACAA